jgi:hypothetical protein
MIIAICRRVKGKKFNVPGPYVHHKPNTAEQSIAADR